jgi:KRAB domain-containing zinc finger protein
MTNNWLNNYEQALDLGQQQHIAKPPQAHQSHQTIKHEHIAPPSYNFDQLNYSGSQASSQQSNVKSIVKKEEGKRFACDLCSYVATQRSSLSRHKMTQHEGIRAPSVKSGKLYDCEVCPYQSTQMATLKRHTMARHSGAQHPCDKCEYIGTTPYNLRLHQKSKHEGIRYTCDICGFQATQTGGLKRHTIAKHTSAQHPCDKCEYLGTTPYNLKLHKDSKHEGIRYPCDICGYQATQRGGLNRHMELKHGIGGRIVPHRSNYMQKRAKKHPDAPKRCMSAFMQFSNGERAGILAQHPELNRIGDMAKELSRRWALATPDMKQKYTEMAILDKERYEKEKHEWHNKQRDSEMSYPVVSHTPNFSPSPNFSQSSTPGPALQVDGNGHYAQAHENTTANRMIGPPNLAF